MGWIVAIAWLTVATVCSIAVLIACLTWQIRLRWRKSWVGPLAIQIRIYSPGHWWTFSCDGRAGYATVLRHWIWPSPVPSTTHLLRQSQHRVRFLTALSPAFTISSWESLSQLGFDDPSLTGECLGLLATMPLPLQKSISITFEREGCRTRGQLDLRVKPIALGWRVLAIWTTTHGIHIGGRGR